MPKKYEIKFQIQIQNIRDKFLAKKEQYKKKKS